MLNMSCPKFVGIMLLVFFSSSAFCVTPQEVNLKIALGLAYKQRMLTQRMAKAYLFKYMNEEPSKAQRELEVAMTMFEESQSILTEFKANAEVADELKKVNILWSLYKKMLGAEPNKENAASVFEGSNQMLSATADVVQAFEKYAITQPELSKPKSAETVELLRNVNMAGKQRMLSQRLCMAYAAYYWSIDEEKAKLVYEQAYDEISVASRALLTSPSNVLEVDELIAEALTEWKPLKDAKPTLQKRELPPSVVYDACTKFMYKMDRVMNIYEKM